MDVADADGGINRRWLAFHAANIVQPAAARDNSSQRMIAVLSIHELFSFFDRHGVE
jgi:hypothetical protein